jgi:hypothetical protein
VQSVGFTVPLLPGRTDAGRTGFEQCWTGPRREAFQDACRRAGITRESVWIQSGPGGHRAVVYLEADDIGDALGLLATSAESFDLWFRAHTREVHGEAWDRRHLDVELVLDFDIDRT